MTLEAAVALFSAVVAVAAVWLDHRARQRDALRRSEEKTRDEARAAREKGSEEQRLQREKALEDQRYEHAQKLQAMERLTDWARRTTIELSLADHILNCPVALRESTYTTKDKVQAAARLSALVDEGRWLFRNHSPGAYGQNKAKLNRGFRDNRLDALVRTYGLLLGDDVIDPMTTRKDFAYKVQQLAIPLSDQVLKEKN